MIISPSVFVDDYLEDNDIKILEAFENQEKVLFECESDFNKITVTQNSVGRFLKFDDTYQAADITHKAYCGGFTYINYYLLAPLFEKKVKKILIAGLGNGKLGTALVNLFPDLELIDYIELDPAVADVARDYFDFKQTDQIRLNIQDARIFIRNTETKYDLIILDVFSQEGLPYRLITDEFFRECKNSLSKDGIISTNLFSMCSMDDDRNCLFKSIIETLKGVFTNIRMFPTAVGNQILYNQVFGLKHEFKGLSNVILFASDSELAPDKLARNVKILQNNITVKNLEKYAKDMSNKAIHTSRFKLLKDEYEFDTDFRLDNLFNYLYINHKENG